MNTMLTQCGLRAQFTATKFSHPTPRKEQVLWFHPTTYFATWSERIRKDVTPFINVRDLPRFCDDKPRVSHLRYIAGLRNATATAATVRMAAVSVASGPPPPQSATAASATPASATPGALPSLPSRAPSRAPATLPSLGLPPLPLPSHARSPQDLARAAVAQAVLHSSQFFGLGGRFAIEGVTGCGGNGAVLKVLDNFDGTYKAIKVVYKSQWDVAGQWPDEILVMVEIGRRLPFSPIVTLEDAWEDPSNFYIIMELFGAWSVSPSLAPIDIPATPFHQAPLSIPFLMGSGDLHGFVQELVGNLGNLSPAICKGLVRQCGQGLHDLHCMQAYHGDVKLSNYLVRYSGGLIEVVLSDLGHCKQTSIHPTFYGTPLLTAPEFLGGYSRHIPKDGCAADVFALGLVFFQLLFSNLFPSIMMNIATGSIGYMQVAASGGASGSLPLDNLGQFLDPEALHLLQGMLMINPCDRFNMAQVMAHPCLN